MGLNFIRCGTALVEMEVLENVGDVGFCGIEVAVDEADGIVDFVGDACRHLGDRAGQFSDFIASGDVEIEIEVVICNFAGGKDNLLKRINNLISEDEIDVENFEDEGEGGEKDDR